jgi:tetratricopeptide (TPR) repeat protein
VDGLSPARWLAGVVLSLALLAGCAHRVVIAPAATAGLPPRVELADTPFHPQERYQCGPAALATVLEVRGVAVRPEALAAQVYLPAREGSLQLELVSAVRRAGLMAVVVAPELEVLLAEIAAGNPVLVLQNLGLDALPRWHYAVAIGYDLERQELLLRSGTVARRVTPFGVFMQTWERASRWGIVVMPPDNLPARAAPEPWLQAASGLEAVGNWAAAAAAYRVASERWPDHPTAWLGLGNARYGLGDGAAAEAALRRALRIEPTSAAAWNNLAHALAARECGRAAVEAARCAAGLAPGHAEVEHTLVEMERASGRDSGVCAPLPLCP